MSKLIPKTRSNGIIAALLSPLVYVIGFIIWGNNWKYSAFGLNVFKCSLASSIFFIVSVLIRPFPSAEDLDIEEKEYSFDLSMIIVSSVLGIVIGDSFWLLALQTIGAHLTIIVDSLKPSLAAILGYVILGEELDFISFGAIILSSVGITLAALDSSDKNSDSETDTKNSGMNSSNGSLLYGLFIAMINVLFDSIGSVMTKKYAKNYNTIEINLLRFGSSSVIMIAAIFFMQLKAYISTHCFPNHGNEETNDPSNAAGIQMYSRVELSEDNDYEAENNSNNDNNDNDRNTTGKSIMSLRNWSLTILGVLLVTVSAPSL